MSSIPQKAYEKVYIGDGAYVRFDGFYIWLTTENGITTTNEVALEPDVLRSFEAYIRDLRSLIEHAGGRL